MKSHFPSIGEYNHLIQKEGGNAFATLKGLKFTPSRTAPLKIYLFGAGSYAAVFKAFDQGKNFAIRCFLSAEDKNILRYEALCKHLSTVDATWKVDCAFLANEIELNGQHYPVLLMDWVEGILINEFTTKHLNDHQVLARLQSKLVELSKSLEAHNIGHGDLQCGNIIIQGGPSDFRIRLIDYDGMFIPNFEGQRNLEKGRSEFQHPQRNSFTFSSKMDRFSIWVILTALEALKYDKSLWREVMQGGFNTLDNFLFNAKDLADPARSPLFNRLIRMNVPSLNYYINHLKEFCESEPASTAQPQLASDIHTQSNPSEREMTSLPATQKQAEAMITVNSTPTGATVFTPTFKKIGITPLQISRETYQSKEIIVTYQETLKKVEIGNRSVIQITFDENSVSPQIQQDYLKSTPIDNQPSALPNNSNVSPKKQNTEPVYGVFSIVLILTCIALIVIFSFMGVTHNRSLIQVGDEKNVIVEKGKRIQVSPAPVSKVYSYTLDDLELHERLEGYYKQDYLMRINGIMDYFADTLVNYFGDNQISKEQVRQGIVRYWDHIYFHETSVNYFEVRIERREGSYILRFPTTYYYITSREKEIYQLDVDVTIKLNSEGKIFFVTGDRKGKSYLGVLQNSLDSNRRI